MLKRYTVESLGKKLVALAVFTFIFLVVNLIRQLLIPSYLSGYSYSYSYSYYYMYMIMGYLTFGYFALTFLIFLFSIILAANFCREGTDYGIDKIKNAGSFLLPATLIPITAIILSLLFSFGGYSYSYGPSYSYETTSNVLRIITIGCSFLKIPAWVSMARYFSEQEGSTAQEKGKGGCVVLSIGVIASIGGVVVSLALSPWRSIMGPSIVEAIIGAVSSCLIAVGYIVVAKSLQEVETAPLTPAYVGGYRTMGAPGYQPSYQPGYQPRVGPSPVATRVPIVGPQPSGYPQAGGYPQPVATPPPAAGRQGDLHFCRHCGQTLPEGTEIVFCPNCGGKVTMG